MEYIPTRFLRSQAREKLTENGERSHLRSEAHHYVNFCSEFTDARAGQWGDGTITELLLLVVDAIRKLISFVSWLAFDVALRRKLLMAARFGWRNECGGVRPGYGTGLIVAEQILRQLSQSEPAKNLESSNRVCPGCRSCLWR